MPLSKDQTKYGLFPALLKYWRGQRGFSQLDLGLAANVSARHISFVETGRSQPSEAMVLRLASVLNLPLRDHNVLLRAAGFDARYPEPPAEAILDGPLGFAVDRMLQAHEPFPMVLVNRLYDVVRPNQAATRLLSLACLQPPSRMNVMHMLFDPNLARTRITNWKETAHFILTRLHRESLHAKNDTDLHELVESLLAYEGVPELIDEPDLTTPDRPVVTIGLALPIGGQTKHFSFLTTITSFNAPQNVTLQELLIESYFPMGDETSDNCKQFLAA